jgi:hypothetical protein
MKRKMKHKAQEILINSLVNWGVTIEQLEDLQLDEKTYAEMHQELQKQTARVLKLFGYKHNRITHHPEDIRFG